MVIQKCKDILRMMAAATGEVTEKVVRDTFRNTPDTSKALRE